MVLGYLTGQYVSPVYAMSQEQQQIFQEGINYFDYSVPCDFSTATASSAPTYAPAGAGTTSSSGIMYDSAAPDKIPSSAKVVATYISNGPGVQYAKKIFPNATVVSINETPGNNGSADIWGIETGSGKTPQSTANAIANGTAHGAYGAQSDLDAVKNILNSKGVPRSSYVLWLWAAGTEGDSSIPAGDDAHQYQIQPGGAAYDVSSISSTFLSTIQGASNPITSGSGSSGSGTCCDTTPTVPVTGGQPPTLIGNNNVQKSFNYFIQAGFTPTQSAGIVGNLMQESGGGTDVNPSSSNGIAGFLDPPESMSDMQNWVNNSDPGQTPSSLKGQLDFVLWYITKSDPSIGNSIKAATTIEAATIAFQNNFEHCGSTCVQDNRIKWANDVINGKYGKATVSAGSGTSVDISSVVKKYNLQSAIIQNLGNGNNIVASSNPNVPPTTPASTMKLVIADTAIQSGLNLNKTVVVTPDLYYNGSNDLSSNKLTLREAMQQMLTESSNVGANVLMKAMGGVSAFTKKAHGYGYTNTNVKGYYDPKNDSINSSTIGDEAAAMNHIFARNSTDYQTAQDALKQAAQTHNTFGVNDIANKWGGTSQVAGNVGLFNINGNRYIIGSYYNGNYTSTPAKNAITNGTKDLVTAVSSSSPSSGSGGACCAPSTSSDPTTLTGSDHTQQVYNFFVNTMGYTPDQAAGAAGSLYFESGGMNPTISNSGSGAYGIAQWLGSRFTHLQTYEGSKYNTLEGQVDFLKAELTGKLPSSWMEDYSSANADVKKATTYQDAQKTWTLEFEGLSKDPTQWYFTKRNGFAHDILMKYGGGSGGGGTTGGGSGTSCGGTVSGSDVVQKAVQAAQELSSYNVPYVWGGMHHAGALDLTDPNKIRAEGADCSGSVSWVLHQAGMFDPNYAYDSTSLETWGQAGKGSEITVWTNSSHAFLEFNVPGVGHYQLNTVSPNGNATWEPWSYSNNDAGQGAVDSGAFTPRHFPGT